LPSIAWPESNSNQKNEIAHAIAIIAAIRATIVTLLICKLSLFLEILGFALSRVAVMSGDGRVPFLVIGIAY
jgi:hypothetical protein